jgi:hypothetical protein
VAAAFENFERVFFVSEAEPVGLLDAKRDDAGRGVFPGPAMRRFPVEVIADAAMAPFRRVLVLERRPAIVAGGHRIVGACWPGRGAVADDLQHRRQLRESATT